MLKRLRTIIPGEDSIYARTIGREAYYAEYRARLQPHPADAELPETPDLENIIVEEVS